MDSMTASEAVDPGSTPGGPTILTSDHIADVATQLAHHNTALS